MGVVKNVERRLEGLLEGFFNRLFRSEVQPVEVGRRIMRSMSEGRTVSVNRTFAPNEFTIELGAEDYERFTKMEVGLVREFSDLIIEQAKENRWKIMGAPTISFVQVDSLGKGEFRVEGLLTADPDQLAPRASTRRPNDDDLAATRAIPTKEAERLGLPVSGARLDIIGEDGNTQESISLAKSPVTIGRVASNDVVLADPNVSRRHSELIQDDGRWAINDLGSTNGTLVNGRAVSKRELKDGDRLAFGTSELVFRSRRS
jgi:FhaA, N-terminal domain/FHA domain